MPKRKREDTTSEQSETSGHESEEDTAVTRRRSLRHQAGAKLVEAELPPARVKKTNGTTTDSPQPVEKAKSKENTPDKDKSEEDGNSVEQIKSPPGRNGKSRGAKNKGKSSSEAKENAKPDTKATDAAKSDMAESDARESDGSEQLNTSIAETKPETSLPVEVTLERRVARVVAEDSLKYTGDNRCPLPGCDSKGHVTGRHDTHRTLTACPIYHNMTAEECKKRHLERESQAAERKKLSSTNRLNLRHQIATSEQKVYQDSVLRQRADCEDVTDAVKAEYLKHKDEYGTCREPLLDGLTSEYDLKLFREAQAKACESVNYELNMHHQLSDKQEYRLKRIELGQYVMDTWYAAPYPEEYTRLTQIYICEYCLKYMKTQIIARRHATKCVWRHPPGDEIYRKGNISVFEVDGKKNKIYCQNLCLLAKLFLDHKTLYYDVEPFLFYVMTEADGQGCHMIGYFSKEKQSFLNYNVSCILTMPPFMRKGYGKLLIDFSYLLSKVEEKIGSPERPLSDLGLISYRSYWKDVLLNYLHNYKGHDICIKDLSQETAVNANDIVSTLQSLGMLKYWKGKHLVLKRQDLIDEYIQRRQSRKNDTRTIDPSCLKWQPAVLNQST